MATWRFIVASEWYTIIDKSAAAYSKSIGVDSAPTAASQAFIFGRWPAVRSPTGRSTPRKRQKRGNHLPRFLLFNRLRSPCPALALRGRFQHPEGLHVNGMRKGKSSPSFPTRTDRSRPFSQIRPPARASIPAGGLRITNPTSKYPLQRSLSWEGNGTPRSRTPGIALQTPWRRL